MKITKSYLKQLIKEELTKLDENPQEQHLQKINDNIGKNVTIVTRPQRNSGQKIEIKAKITGYDEERKNILLSKPGHKFEWPLDLVISINSQKPDHAYKPVRGRGGSEEAEVHYWNPEKEDTD